MKQRDSVYSRLTRALPWLVWLAVALLIGAARPWENISALMSAEFYSELLRALFPWVVGWICAWAAVIVYYVWTEKRRKKRFEAELRSKYNAHKRKEVES